MAHTNQHVEPEHLSSECTFEKCEVCQKLAELEREVETIQETLRILAQQRVALNSSRNTVHDRLSTKLPVEIICRIFVFVDNFPDKHPATLSESEIYFCAPVILSSVCRRWREIALALPILWTNLHINVGERPDQIDIIEDCLDRSGAQPLNLTIYSKNDKGSNQSEISQYYSICNILRKHSARWQHINLNSAPDDILHILFNGLQAMPQSDSLELLLGTVHSSKTILLDPPFRPRRYHAGNTEDSLGIVPCEWNNLTHLELIICDMIEALNIFRVAHKLRRCVLKNVRHSPSKPAVPVKHSSLDDLAVTFHNTATGTKFFKNITIPSLRHLTYEYLGIRHEQNFDALRDFLSRSHLSYLSLQTFSLKCFATLLSKPNDIQELAGVTHLSIDMHAPLGNEFNILKAFLFKMSNRSVFPYLQDLRINLGTCPEISTKLGLYQAALTDFVTKHNSQLQLAKAGLEQGISGRDTVGGIPLPQKNVQNPSLASNELPPYRPLRSISIRLQRWKEADAEAYNAQRKSESDAVLQECWFPNKR